MLHDSPTICLVPFRELHINTAGKYRNCCIQKESTYRINLSIENTNLWFQKEYDMNKLRHALTNGIKHPNCEKCWKLEEQGLTSYRENWNRQYQANKNVDLENRIEVIDLRLGNRCNLQCRMCNSTWSDQISKQLMKLESLGVSNSYTKMPIIDTVRQSDKFMEDLLYFVKRTPTIKEIKLAGGEPFAMVEVEEFLYKLVEEGITDLEISLLTNTTVVKERMVNTLEKFSKTHIQCSIDGIGSFLEYQRFPADWSVIERNFIKLYNSKLTVNLTPCWSNLNLLSMGDFLEWTNQFPKSYVAYNEVNTPSYLDWKLIPLNYRIDLLKKLNSISLHDKVHKDYNKMSYRIANEIREFTTDEIELYNDAVTAWDSISNKKYLDLYCWNKHAVK